MAELLETALILRPDKVLWHFDEIIYSNLMWIFNIMVNQTEYSV